ncbi:hypothetical protein FQA47_017266 [Oryzias melastigma]|uniref:Uncharacterized protein n=1 Tax=Oryzias melastigma TaxID=30732 RepID=A0A834FLY5_ORYME|nr:hypothetical protein FQA47_017266 [Oryzias melastigma]
MSFFLFVLSLQSKRHKHGDQNPKDCDFKDHFPDDSCQRLTLSGGLSSSIEGLINEAKQQCGLKGSFKLQFMDSLFGNEFFNLTSVSEVEDKEVTVNSLKNKPAGKRTAAFGVKKAKRAEVKFCPMYPSEETEESLDAMQKSILLDVKKKNNREVVKYKMEHTFAHRRHEVVHDAPMVKDFMAKWPALFDVIEGMDEESINDAIEDTCVGIYVLKEQAASTDIRIV